MKAREQDPNVEGEKGDGEGRRALLNRKREEMAEIKESCS